MKKLVLMAALATPWLAWAEGLSLDEKGNLQSPHTVVTLNESQQEELITMESVTLTVEQWQNLRKVSPNTPKRLQGFIPITYRDCFCGVSFDAIQLSATQIAIMHLPQSPESLLWRLNGKQSLAFYVDRRGQFYLEGVLTQFPKLLAAIEKSERFVLKPKNHTEPEEIFADVYPGQASIEVPMGMLQTDAIFKERIHQVYYALARKGWNGGKNPLDQQ
ncbi:MAG TPA: hypothetical protein VIM57_06880 [Luteolibacter sp.]